MNIEQYIITESDKKIYDLFSKIPHSEHYMRGLLTMLETEDQKKILIEELENGLTDIKTIMYLACDIADGLEV